MKQKKSVVYTAIVLSPQSRTLLKQLYKHQLTDGWEWIGDHMTICGGASKNSTVKEDLELGGEVYITATHIGRDDNAIALLVQGYGGGPTPHVTLACNRANNRNPSDSNNIQEWNALETPLVLRGLVQEVFNMDEDAEPITDLSELSFADAVLNRGGEIYLVGGFVRDQELGIESKDLDLMVRLIPAEELIDILDTFGVAKRQLVGGKFAMIKWTKYGTKKTIDVALPRTEKKVAVGHGGFDVTADHTITVKQDSDRRDFTVNALLRKWDGTLVDPQNGLQDLKDKIIRMIYKDSFSDDPLRMMRAIRFASKLGFEIHEGTWQAITNNAHLIKEISGERILGELDEIVAKGDKKLAIQLLESSGLFRHIFGYRPSFNPDFVDMSTNMAEFIFTLLMFVTRQPAMVYTNILKGGGHTIKLIHAFEVGFFKEAENEFERREKVCHIFKIAPDALNSWVVRDLCNLGPTVDIMNELKIPFSISELSMDGNDLMNLGLKDKGIGDMLHQLMDAIRVGVIQNEFSQLSGYAHNPKPELIQQIKERFK